jgi:hypothetical protein
MNIKILFLSVVIVFGLRTKVDAQQINSALHTNANNLYLVLPNAKSRSISAENPTGEKGKGAMAKRGPNAMFGQGWKVRPDILMKPGEIDTLANIAGPGAIKQIWMTPNLNWRDIILRIYWDGEKEPSVEVPVGYFFAAGWQEYHQISSLMVAHNSKSGLNSYWVMPFHKHCLITIENKNKKTLLLFYQINYVLTDVPKNAGYFHAQYRQEHPVPFKKVYTVAKIKGRGQYVGTYLTLETNNERWWGEGEFKFYIDGDKKFPTIVFTGTEDYFNGSYGFITLNKEGKAQYTNYTTPYSGFYALKDSHKPMESGERFGMYRWHIHAPIRFDRNLKVTMRDLGAKKGKNGVHVWPRQDDISSVAYWYQIEPHAPFPELPSKNDHE